MKTLKQCIDEWKKSWVECNVCKDMFDSSSLRPYTVIKSSKGTKHFCDECSDIVSN